MKDEIRVVLLDIGGVLVQLSGVTTILGWLHHEITAEELWALWLKSPSVRAFETGRMEPMEFADGMVSELGIDVSPRDFLDSFLQWPVGLFPGALEMLAGIPGCYRRAVLSNTNALHYPRLMHEMGLAGAFDHYFFSHLIGKVKPDAEAFRHVLDVLDCRAREVLFLDDNALNVDAARALGMHARVVQGVEDARQVLCESGLMASAR